MTTSMNLGERNVGFRRHECITVWHGRHPMGVGLLLLFTLLGESSYAADAPLAGGANTANASTAVIATAGSQAAAESIEWSVSGAAGPVISTIQSPSAGPWPPSFGIMSTAWQIDLQRRRKGDRFVGGVTLEGTYDRHANGTGQQLLGVDVFVGTDWRHRHWAVEATIGAGLEAAQFLQQDVVNYWNSNLSGNVYHLSYQLGVYAQGTLAAVVPVSNAVEILLRLGVHLTGSHDENWFAASTIGLRYRLP